jgi:hypothetical protein
MGRKVWLAGSWILRPIISFGQRSGLLRLFKSGLEFGHISSATATTCSADVVCLTGKNEDPRWHAFRREAGHDTDDSKDSAANRFQRTIPASRGVRGLAREEPMHQRLNIQLSSKDLEAIQKRALAEGLPYQTLIASVLHKYASGRLKEG